MLCEERFMFKKLNLIQCIIVLLMVVFIPFRGFHPILFTIGGWLGTMLSYVYYKGSECIDKQCEQNLMQLLGDKFNSNETPEQNLVRNGYLQVYDCGSIEVIYRKEVINDNKEK